MYKAMNIGKKLRLEVGAYWLGGIGLGLTVQWPHGMVPTKYWWYCVAVTFLCWTFDLCLANEGWRDNPDVLTFKEMQ